MKTFNFVIIILLIIGAVIITREITIRTYTCPKEQNKASDDRDDTVTENNVETVSQVFSDMFIDKGPWLETNI